MKSYVIPNPLKDLNCKLFDAIMNAAYTTRGFATKQITESLNAFDEQLCGTIAKLHAKVGRLIAQLRAHKIGTKLPRTFRYRVTGYGQKVLTRILMFKKLDIKFC